MRWCRLGSHRPASHQAASAKTDRGRNSPSGRRLGGGSQTEKRPGWPGLSSRRVRRSRKALSIVFVVVLRDVVILVMVAVPARHLVLVDRDHDEDDDVAENH